MDRLTVQMVKLSLCWLLVGFVIGGLMLVDRAIPGDWRAWMAPTHGHMLFVGWFVQFALGIAYWLLPRKRTPGRPLGYNERLSLGAVAALNAGLLLRVISEPFERTGHASNATLTGLALAAILQVLAAVIFVMQIWPRILEKTQMGKQQPVRQATARDRTIKTSGDESPPT
ncbi:MAG TPA: cbb3-type cytochrome c oxidase subunit I [Thermomicrobiales bacterium]|nr:cbb3-type cytochrome c oxidase subunit I [Thermomicrobiales bacterium]